MISDITLLVDRHSNNSKTFFQQKLIGRHASSNLYRSNELVRFFGKMHPQSFSSGKSNKSWKLRRDACNKTMGFNFASKYLPLMLKALDDRINTWENEQWLNFNKEISGVSFEIISQILFGNDFQGKVPISSLSLRMHPNMFLQQRETT